MPAISVIIPVYNVEGCLERCLDSLISQTYPDWEAVCVDDGSTDNSPGILDRYAATDGRIRVIHKQNEGVSITRNVAVKKAVGKWMMFVDSDDFLHPQAMEICVSLTKKEDADLVAFTYSRGFRAKIALRHLLHLPEPGRIDYRKYDLSRLKYVVTDDIFGYATEYSKPSRGGIAGPKRRWAVKHCQPWRCMYRSELVENMEFVPGIIYEDFPWWTEVLLTVRRCVILNLPLYFYYPSFGGYILSSRQDFRIDSLRKALAVADGVVESKATDVQKKSWLRNFRRPFEAKLNKKLKKRR